MRRRQFVSGLKNSQKVRIICNGVGFYTTVAGAFDMCMYEQRVAVTSVLSSLAAGQKMPGNTATGIATRMRVFNHEGRQVEVDVQVDLV